MKDRKQTIAMIVLVMLVLVSVSLIKMGDASERWIILLALVPFMAVLVFLFYQAYIKSPLTGEPDVLGEEREKILDRLMRPPAQHLPGLIPIAFLVFMTLRDGAEGHDFVFIGIVCAFMLSRFLFSCWAQGKERDQVAKVFTGWLRILSCLFSLACTGFCCFWCYIAIRHGIWFMVPFGIGVGILVARPLVGEIAWHSRKNRDPGEDHLNFGAETEPWDIP